MPDNIQRIRERFVQEIHEQRLVIETRALLAGHGEKGEASFFVDENSVWGTLHRDWAERNQRLGSQNKVITVKTMDPHQAFKLYGVPYL